MDASAGIYCGVDQAGYSVNSGFVDVDFSSGDFQITRFHVRLSTDPMERIRPRTPQPLPVASACLESKVRSFSKIAAKLGCHTLPKRTAPKCFPESGRGCHDERLCDAADAARPSGILARQCCWS
jgi:hypothetical protein